MIKELSEANLEIAEASEFCIIGAGAAGISLCLSLARKGHTVTLLDGGGFDEADVSDDSYRGKAEEPHADTTEYRRQRLGGTTHLWGGRCVPFDKQDFETRSHIPNSGWPVTTDVLTPYLHQAQDYCHAGEYDYSVSSLKNPEPMFDELAKLKPELSEYIERYSLPTDFGKEYLDELATNDKVQVILKARCVQLKLHTSGDAVCSVVLSDQKREFELHHRCFVLAGGGIETTRLLLRAQKEHSTLQNLQALGKYYTCHYDLIFGELKFFNKKPKFDFQKTRDGIYARRKLQFSSEFQNQKQLLNTTFRLHFPAYSDASHRSGVLSLIYLAKSILPGEHQDILDHGKLSNEASPMGAHIANVVRDCFSIVRFSFDWLFKIKLAKRKLPYTLQTNSRGTYPLELNSEQIPHPDNNITLLEEQDSFGMPRVAVRWSLQKEDIDSGIRSFQELRELLKRSGVCELNYDEDGLQNAVMNALPIGGHHLGTTRMGESVETSVVDSDCRVHGLKNLYVASSSIFTSSGHANPTLLIVAFALRLAEHLSNKNEF